jgi:hypothetical protein
MAKVLGSALAFAFALLSSGRALADDATSFRFSWVRGEGTGSCPDARTLAARAAVRLRRDPFSETAKQSIEGSVVLDGPELKAELRLRDEAGVVHGRRELRSKQADCVELAEAVVLAVVLTIDPNAAFSDAPAPVAPTPPSVPPTASPGAAEPPALGACPVVRCPTPGPCPAARCPPPPPLEAIAFTARVVGGIGILPGFAPGAAAAGEVGGAHVRGSFGIVYFPEATTTGGEFAFGVTTGTLGAIFAWPLAGSIDLAAVVELQVGAIHAVVFESDPVNPGDQLWLAGALGPRLGFSPFRPFRLEVGVSLVVPATRPSFDVRGASEPAFQSAPVGGMAHIGAGVGLP